MRAAEVNEEIELAWHSTAQRSLAGASQAGGGLVSGDQANSQSPSQDVAEPLKAEPNQPAVGPGPAEPAVARTRGRPRKVTEEEPKVEKKVEAKLEAGKRQKSLFDF